MMMLDFYAETGIVKGDMYRAVKHCKPDGEPHDKTCGSNALLYTSYWIEKVYAGVVIDPAELAAMVVRDRKGDIWKAAAKRIQRKVRRILVNAENSDG